MALDREVSSLERVEVVEADRELGAEARRDLRAEDRLALGSQQELEPDLEPVDEQRRLGCDELVRPGEVRRVALHAELALQPMTAPRPGQKGGARAKGLPGEAGERLAERVAREPERCEGIGEVDVAVDPREQRLLVAVEHRPVHEQQPLLRAARARGLADVRRLAASHRRQRQALRDVGVPELVVCDERASGPEDDRRPRRRAAARRRGRPGSRSTGA